MVKKNILISAYALSPVLGSEFGVGWNFVSRLSNYYNITVLFGTCRDRMGISHDLLQYVAAHPNKNIDFVFVNPGRMARFFDYLNHHVSRLFFFVALEFYQRDVYNIASRLARRRNYVLAHQLNPIGFRQPGYLWKLNIPFVWGPVGGSSNLDWGMLPSLGLSDALRHAVRNLSNEYFLRYSKKLKKAVAQAHVIFAATTRDAANFNANFGVVCPVIRENSVRQPRGVETGCHVPLRFILVGNLESRKGLGLLLEALRGVPPELDWLLDVVGDGPEANRLKKKCESYGLTPKVIWHGAVTRVDAVRLMEDADVHLLPSVMDSNPTVLLEAFECGIPSIALDQFGAADLIDEDTGIKVGLGTREHVISGLRAGVVWCVRHPNRVLEMKKRVREKAERLTWDSSIEQLRSLYLNVEL